MKAAVDAVSRRHRLSSEEADDLSSQVYLKIIENDYSVLRMFRGRSSLKTYLAVVATRVYLDDRTRAWGRWRASAAAKRYGPTGIAFERLTLRDGVPFDDACRLLEQVHGFQVDRPALDRLSQQLPLRGRRQQVDASVLEDMPSPADAPDAPMLEAARRKTRAAVSRAVATEVGSLADADRRLVQRRFADGVGLQDMAHEIPVPPKFVYRRLARVLATLRRRLERRGISRIDIVDALQHPRLPADAAGR